MWRNTLKKTFGVYIVLIFISVVILYPDYIYIAKSNTELLIPINNIGNTLNGGSFFEDDNTLYGRIAPNCSIYSSQNHFSLSSKKIGQTDIMVLDSVNDPSNVIIHNETIYYRNTVSHEMFPQDEDSEYSYSCGYIYGINLDTGSYCRITDKEVYVFYIYDEKIYYQAKSSIDKKSLNTQVDIYCCSLNGENESLIYTYSESDSTVSGLFSIYNQKIYIPLTSGILQYTVDTKNTVFFPNTLFGTHWQVVKVLPIQDTLFVGLSKVSTSSRCFCSLDIETGEVRVISDVTCDNYTGDNRNIYFFENCKLYRYDFSGNIYTLIADHPDFLFAFDPEIIGDEIYFFQTQVRGGYGRFCKISLQTGELTNVTDTVQVTQQVG